MVEKLDCKDYVIRIVQKSSTIGNMLMYTEDDYNVLLNSDKNALMLNLKE